MSRALSLVVTTRNNAATLGACLESVPFADEIVVLDSFSDDGTVELARSLGAHCQQEAFRGYGPQKQRAIDLAGHDWVLLLDADEVVDQRLAEAIRRVLQEPEGPKACRLQREEWLYWRWPRPGTRLTDHLRLFDRRFVRMGNHPVHAAPQLTTGQSSRGCPLLPGRLRHFGHANLGGQVDRINHYTSVSLEGPEQTASRLPRTRLILAPPAAFVREYLFRRQFLNGWAGFIAARMAAWHAFLRHAKRLESLHREDIE
jgi:glycosyltransferase involved in cell wall biosynthesis